MPEHNLALLLSGATKRLTLSTTRYSYIGSAEIYCAQEDNFGRDKQFILSITFIDGTKATEFFSVSDHAARQFAMGSAADHLRLSNMVEAVVANKHREFEQRLAVPNPQGNEQNRALPHLQSGGTVNLTHYMRTTNSFNSSSGRSDSTNENASEYLAPVQGFYGESEQIEVDRIAATRGVEPIAFTPRAEREPDLLDLVEHEYDSRNHYRELLLLSSQLEQNYVNSHQPNDFNHAYHAASTRPYTGGGISLDRSESGGDKTAVTVYATSETTFTKESEAPEVFESKIISKQRKVSFF